MLVAIAAGGVGALLAIGLQYVAAAIVGFVAGSYGSMPLVILLFGHGASWVPLLGGIVGAVLMVLLFDWTLIVLSALAGARAVLLPFGLTGRSLGNRRLAGTRGRWSFLSGREAGAGRPAPAREPVGCVSAPAA